jgi:7-carboxy-7-deazaguanine synthase
MEIFYSIQGEGFHSGKPAIFIRLGGCDVGCHWCDVKESWDENDHPKMTVEQIMDDIKDFPSKTIIITGGEPLMYNLNELTSSLKALGYSLHIETSGVYQFTGDFDWVCFSPKKFKNPHQSIYAVANELKAIIFNKSDFKFADSFLEHLNDDCLHYLQPEWSKADAMTPQIIEFVKNNPNWNISMQTHKYLNIP